MTINISIHYNTTLPEAKHSKPNTKDVLAQLTDALDRQDWQLVSEFLLSDTLKIDVNIPLPSNGNSTLSFIISYHQWDLVRALLECQNSNHLDFDFQIENKIDSHTTSLLWILAWNEQWELLNKIIESPKSSHLNFNEVSSNKKHRGKTVLFLIAQAKQWTLISHLLHTPKQLSLNFNALSQEGQSPLWLIAQSNQWDLFKLIINEQRCEPVDLNVSPHEGFHANKSILWLITADSNRHDLIQCLLNSSRHIKLDFNQECSCGPDLGLTPLFQLISQRDSSESWTTVSWIIESDRCEVLNFNIYSKIPSLYSTQKSAFWYLCQLGTEEIINQVIESDKCFIDPNFYPLEGEQQGTTPLYFLVKHGYFNAIKKLLEKYPNLNSKIVPYPYGIPEDTPFNLLSQLKQEEIIRLLHI